MLYISLVIASLVLTFTQISLGGVVRITESGLGCPDWPLCHGQIIPPLDLHTLIEYSHRLTGTVVGILIIALLLMTFYYRKKDSLLMKSAFASFLLVILAGLLGGAVVVTELEWWIRLVHLSIAQALIATLVVMLWRISSTMVIPPIDSVISTNNKKLWQWTLFGLITLTFITLISGSFMVGMGSSASCTTWPLCGGKFGFPYDVHMAHRYIAGITLIAMLYIGFKLLRKFPGYDFIKKSVHSMVGMISLQIITGAILIWGEFDPALKALHLASATLVWMTTVFAITASISIFWKNNSDPKGTKQDPQGITPK